MVHKCCVFGCRTGYREKASEKIAVFHFPLKKERLCLEWIRFVNRRNWEPSKTSVICEKHFEDHYIRHGKRTTLNWVSNPVPTALTKAQAEHHSTIPTKLTSRPPPKNRSLLPDELNNFNTLDKITGFECLDESLAPPNYSFHQSEEQYVVYYELCFEEFPKIRNAIKIDNHMKVKLQHNGLNVPLPKWFTSQRTLQLTKKSMLLNFPSYMNGFDDNDNNELDLLEELHSIKYYKAAGHPAFSAKMIRFCFLLRFTSTQAYRTLLKTFPMPSLSMLHSVTCGTIQSLKAIKLVKDKGEICDDVVVMVDEMYLQKVYSIMVDRIMVQMKMEIFLKAWWQ